MQSCNFRFVQKARSSCSKSIGLVSLHVITNPIYSLRLWIEFECIGFDCSWEECAQPKVVVKIETEDEMLELQVSFTIKFWIFLIEIYVGSTALVLLSNLPNVSLFWPHKELEIS